MSPGHAWGERALRVVGSTALVLVAAQWIAAAPWGQWGWWRASTYSAVGALPFFLLAWLGWRKRPNVGWLALGACSASLWLGLSGSTYFSYYFYDSTTAHDFAHLLPVVAALALLGAGRLRGEATRWQWRCSSVALGAVLPWILLYFLVALSSYIWDFGNAYPWWRAPQAAIPLVPLAVGGIALWRGRTWGLLPLALSALLALMVEVPEPVSSCFGPQGHPFSYGWALEFIIAAPLLAIAPWIAPVIRALSLTVEEDERHVVLESPRGKTDEVHELVGSPFQVIRASRSDHIVGACVVEQAVTTRQEPTGSG